MCACLRSTGAVLGDSEFVKARVGQHRGQVRVWEDRIEVVLGLGRTIQKADQGQEVAWVL